MIRWLELEDKSVEEKFYEEDNSEASSVPNQVTSSSLENPPLRRVGYVRGKGGFWLAWMGGNAWIPDEDGGDLGLDGKGVQGVFSGDILAPMAGRVLEVIATKNADVLEGDGLVVLEAMKMEHRLVAPCKARVTEVLVQAGDVVQQGQKLAQLKPEPEVPNAATGSAAS